MINPQNTIETALKGLLGQGAIHPGATVVIISSILVGDQLVDAIQMRVL